MKEIGRPRRHTMPRYCWKKPGGGIYYRRGKPPQYVPIEAEPGTTAFYRRYAEIHESFQAAPKGVARTDTLAAVALIYQASDQWSVLAPKTKATYKSEIDEIVRIYGDIHPKQMTRRLIIEYRDNTARVRSPRTAVERIKVLRLLLQQAYDLDLVDRNHAAKIKPPHGYKAEPWRHWEPEEIKLFLAGAEPRWRRAVMVLLYTGLRVGDAVKIRRQDIEGGVIRWVTGKTGTPVVIPLHTDLLAELERPVGGVESIYLIAGLKGAPMLVTSVNHGVRKQFQRLGIETPPPLHGLRKNSVMALLEAGAAKDEVRAITGQSDAMIEHYGKKFDRERLAQAAILKLERKG